jgi:hypothetical protein
MDFIVVVTKDNQPRSFRWGIRLGINQVNELPLSRAEKSLSGARRSAERVFGPLTWFDAHAPLDAGFQPRADERNAYVIECAVVWCRDGAHAAQA